MLTDFQIWLKKKKLSDKSVKNYLSDVRQFLSWTAKNSSNQLTPNTFATYRSHLLVKKTPTKSINRYLSSLRKFGEFLKQEKQMMVNPVSNLENIKKQIKQTEKTKKFKTGQEELMENFRQSMQKQKLSKATIKNYVSDINQFLTWLEKN